MSDVRALLQPMKDRLAAATELGEWEVRGKDIVIYAPNGFGAYRAVAWVDHAEYTPVIAHAPTDQAKLIAAIEGVEALADAWQARGEHLLEFSKTAPEDVAEALFTDAGSMLHNATLVRAALTQALGGDTA